MMTEELTTLVERKLVTEETVVYANVKSIGLGGTITFIKKDVYWHPWHAPGAIYDIEGMTPRTLCKSIQYVRRQTSKEYKKRDVSPRLYK